MGARESIFLDRVNPSDFLKNQLIFCCEQCSFYDPDLDKCTMGYNPENHKREKQLKTYELSGRMAFCRFLEID